MEKTAIIVDANIILSAAINPRGLTHRKLLALILDPGITLYTPKYLVEEIDPKIEEIAARKGFKKRRATKRHQPPTSNLQHRRG